MVRIEFDDHIANKWHALAYRLPHLFGQFRCGLDIQLRINSNREFYQHITAMFAPGRRCDLYALNTAGCGTHLFQQISTQVLVQQFVAGLDPDLNSVPQNEKGDDESSNAIKARLTKMGRQHSADDCQRTEHVSQIIARILLDRLGMTALAHPPFNPGHHHFDKECPDGNPQSKQRWLWNALDELLTGVP